MIRLVDSLRWVGPAIVLGVIVAGPARGQEVRGAVEVEDDPGAEVLLPALLEPTFLLSVGRIVDPASHRGQLEILGSAKEGDIEERSLSVFDEVFVPAVVDGRPLRPDELVQFYRLGATVPDPESAASWGRILVPTGAGRVDSVSREVARIVVTHAFRPIVAGNAVRRVETADTTAVVSERGERLDAEGYVLAYHPEKAIHPPYDIAYLRIGSGALAPGESIRLFRDGPVRRGHRLPPIWLGRAMVVRVDGEIAAAILTSTGRSDLRSGDRFEEAEEEEVP